MNETDTEKKEVPTFREFFDQLPKEYFDYYLRLQPSNKAYKVIDSIEAGNTNIVRSSTRAYEFNTILSAMYAVYLFKYHDKTEDDVTLYYVSGTYERYLEVAKIIRELFCFYFDTNEIKLIQNRDELDYNGIDFSLTIEEYIKSKSHKRVLYVTLINDATYTFNLTNCSSTANIVVDYNKPAIKNDDTLFSIVALELLKGKDIRLNIFTTEEVVPLITVHATNGFVDALISDHDYSTSTYTNAFKKHPVKIFNYSKPLEDDGGPIPLKENYGKVDCFEDSSNYDKHTVVNEVPSRKKAYRWKKKCIENQRKYFEMAGRTIDDKECTEWDEWLDKYHEEEV